jgi:hypothetical protein
MCLSNIESSLNEAQQSTNMHDDPEGRALAQPRHNARSNVRSTAPAGLAQRTGANDEPHVRHTVVFPHAHKRTTMIHSGDAYRGEQDPGGQVHECDCGSASIYGVGERVRVAVERALDRGAVGGDRKRTFGDPNACASRMQRNCF